MATTEQRIPLLPSAAASVLKSLGGPVHPGDDGILASGLSNSGKIILQPTVPDSWACMAQVASSRFAYDSLFQNGVASYGRYVERYQPFDLSVLAGSRRKNATRETTSTLKAWLHEHRKNPYPTKGEKIMLAILTKMTLTQVSTWFANARRRLKKENKMTWLPRNKSGSRDGDKNYHAESKDKEDTLNSDSEETDSDFESGDEREGVRGMEKSTSSVDPTSPKDTKKCDSDSLPGDSLSTDCTNEIAASKGNKSVSEEEASDNQTWVFSTKSLKRQDVLRFGIGNSPVNNLQRWMNVCFETQSPVDFPKELTPPHTPVEHRKQPLPSNSVVNACTKEVLKDRKDDASFVVTNEVTSISSDGTTETSLTLSSLARLTETRPCILTSHRELDAVLALTSLASR